MKKQTKPIKQNDLLRTLDNVRVKCNKELTDVVAGPMTLKELTNEIATQCIHRSPEYMIILIEKREDLQKYHSTVYLTSKDFKKYRLNRYSKIKL